MMPSSWPLWTKNEVFLLGGFFITFSYLSTKIIGIKCVKVSKPSFIAILYNTSEVEPRINSKEYNHNIYDLLVDSAIIACIIFVRTIPQTLLIDTFYFLLKVPTICIYAILINIKYVIFVWKKTFNSAKWYVLFLVERHRNLYMHTLIKIMYVIFVCKKL